MPAHLRDEPRMSGKWKPKHSGSGMSQDGYASKQSQNANKGGAVKQNKGSKGKGDQGSKGKGGNGKGRLDKDACGICFQKGHWKNDCPNKHLQNAAQPPPPPPPPTRVGNIPGGSSDYKAEFPLPYEPKMQGVDQKAGKAAKGGGKGRCAICYEEGHWKNECPNRNEQQKGKGGPISGSFRIRGGGGNDNQASSSNNNCTWGTPVRNAAASAKAQATVVDLEKKLQAAVQAGQRIMNRKNEDRMNELQQQLVEQRQQALELEKRAAESKQSVAKGKKSKKGRKNNVKLPDGFSGNADSSQGGYGQQPWKSAAIFNPHSTGTPRATTSTAPHETGTAGEDQYADAGQYGGQYDSGQQYDDAGQYGGYDMQYGGDTYASEQQQYNASDQQPYVQEATYGGNEQQPYAPEATYGTGEQQQYGQEVVYGNEQCYANDQQQYSQDQSYGNDQQQQQQYSQDQSQYANFQQQQQQVYFPSSEDCTPMHSQPVTMNVVSNVPVGNMTTNMSTNMTGTIGNMNVVQIASNPMQQLQTMLQPFTQNQQFGGDTSNVMQQPQPMQMQPLQQSALTPQRSIPVGQVFLQPVGQLPGFQQPQQQQDGFQQTQQQPPQ